MNAVIVCKDYGDILKYTLPWNRGRFDQVMVVTSPDDGETQTVCEDNKTGCLLTECFTEDGASFNKFKALEQGLDAIGRQGWLCILDADVLLPKRVEFKEEVNGHLFVYWRDDEAFHGMNLSVGCLMTPRRRMLERLRARWFHDHEIGYLPFPQERDWQGFPVHPQAREWAGYCQMFHASDPVLGPPPWHRLDLPTAQGGDSLFQAKWPQEKKVRPPFEALHLGRRAENWRGRKSARLN